MSHLEYSLRKITGLLNRQHIPYMLIGGIANMYWGRSRLTQDLDITILCQEEKLPQLVETIEKHFKLLPEDPIAFLKQTRVLPVITDNGVRIDLIFAGLPYEEKAVSRAITKKFGKLSARVCTAEDLIIHKIISERSLDLEDVRWIIKRQYENLDRDYLNPLIQELSRLLDRPEIWQTYLQFLSDSKE